MNAVVFDIDGTLLESAGKNPGTWWCLLRGAVVAVFMVNGYELLRRVLRPNVFNGALPPNDWME